MKRLVCCVIVMCVVIFMIRFAVADERLRVVVVDLKADGVPQTKARILSNMLRNELVNDGRFVVIERNQMENILKEQGFQQTGCTDQACVVEMGRLLSANKMLVGEVSAAGNTLYITVRVVDVEKGVVEFAEKEIAQSDERLDKVTASLSRKLSDKIEAGYKKQHVAKEKKSVKTDETVAQYSFVMKGLLLEYSMIMPQATKFKEYYGQMHGGGLGYIYMFNDFLGLRVTGIVNTGSAKDADVSVLCVNGAGGIIAGYPLFNMIYAYMGLMGKGVWLRESASIDTASFGGYGAEILAGLAFNVLTDIGLFVEYIYSYGKLIDKTGTDVTSGILQAGVSIYLGW